MREVDSHVREDGDSSTNPELDVRRGGVPRGGGADFERRYRYRGGGGKVGGGGGGAGGGGRREDGSEVGRVELSLLCLLDFGTTVPLAFGRTSRGSRRSAVDDPPSVRIVKIRNHPTAPHPPNQTLLPSRSFQNPNHRQQTPVDSNVFDLLDDLLRRRGWCLRFDILVVVQADLVRVGKWRK